MPPGGRKESEEGEGGASDRLRTAMEDMEVGGDKMDEVEAAKAEGDNVEAGGGRLRGDLLALESTGFLTKDTEPGRTALVDA